MSGKSNDIFDRQTGRNLTLDIYKGVLIVLVVLRHVLQYSVSDEGGILTNFIWAIQMPGFMLAAGYFAVGSVENWSAAGKRIVLSAQHYALPFFAWFVLVNCLLRGGYGRNPIKAVTTLLTHVDGGLWFLWVVFVLSIVFTLVNLTLSSANGRIAKMVVVLIICFGILGAAGLLFGISFIGIKFILYYAVFYGFGWLVRWTKEWWRYWWPKVSNVVVAAALIIFLTIVYNYDLYHASDNLIGITLRCIAGFTGNLVLLWVCSRYDSSEE